MVQCQECLLIIYIINLKIFGSIKYQNNNKKRDSMYDGLHFKKVSVVSVAVTALLHFFIHCLLTGQLEFFYIQKSWPEGHTISVTLPNKYDLSGDFSFVIALHSTCYLMTSKYWVHFNARRNICSFLYCLVLFCFSNSGQN